MNKKKSRQQRKKKNFYALQHTKTEFNKKKKLGRHIRHFPVDIQAIDVYEKKYGVGTAKGLLASTTLKGEKLAMRNMFHKSGLI